MQRLLDRLEPQARAAFLDAISKIRSEAQLKLIIDHLTAGNVDAAILALRLDPSFFQPLDRAISEAYWQGGLMALAALPRITDPFNGSRVVLGFDGRHPRAEAWVKEKSSTLITAIVSEQRELVRSVVRQGVIEGKGPRDVALDIVGRVDKLTGKRVGGILGLTTPQAGYVANARAELSSGTPSALRAYLSRTLRDKRYDAVVRKALKDGSPIPKAMVQLMSDRYAAKLLKMRGDMIARTESINALRAGQWEGYKQLLSTGAVSDDQISRSWQSTGDLRTRPHHMEMQGQKVTGIDSLFTAPDGSKMRFPGDTAYGASAAETIQCRCFMQVRIAY